MQPRFWFKSFQTHTAALSHLTFGLLHVLNFYKLSMCVSVCIRVFVWTFYAFRLYSSTSILWIIFFFKWNRSWDLECINACSRLINQVNIATRMVFAYFLLSNLTDSKYEHQSVSLQFFFPNIPNFILNPFFWFHIFFFANQLIINNIT